MERTWVNETMFYHIYPLGMTGAPRENKGIQTSGNRILEVMDWIPHLKEMGINAIYFGPLLESGTHGYDTHDYKKLDTRLGSNEDFKKVCAKLHSEGIRVILDGVFNHVGRGFAPFRDVLTSRENSQYKDWFAGMNFGGNNSYDDHFSYENWGGCDELVKLNLYHDEVKKYILDSIDLWIKEWDIDGLRLDAADCIQKDFFKELRSHVKAQKSDFWLMGEIIHGDYAQWANSEMLDSVTNYECWKGIYSSHNDHNYFEIGYALKRQSGEGGIYKDITLYNFLDNHDVNRIASLLTENENIYNCYTMLYTMPGVPSIYYGSEWGMEGEKTKGADADYPVRPRIRIKDMENANLELINHISTLAQIRQNNEAIRYGSYEEVVCKNEQLIYARRYENKAVLVALNLTNQEVTLDYRYEGEDYKVVLEANAAKVLHWEE